MSEQNDDRDLDETEPDETPGSRPTTKRKRQRSRAGRSARARAARLGSDDQARREGESSVSPRHRQNLRRELRASRLSRVRRSRDHLGAGRRSARAAAGRRRRAVPACNAFGVTITGSKNPEQATKPCDECGGRGWRNVVAPLEPVATMPAPALPTDTPIGGQYVPGKGFIPYGATEPLPGTNFGGL
jgi:hypothetical protein